MVLNRNIMYNQDYPIMQRNKRKYKEQKRRIDRKRKKREDKQEDFRGRKKEYWEQRRQIHGTA